MSNSNNNTVLRVHPKAAAQFLKGIAGSAPPYNEDHWRIHRGDGDFAETIGVGHTKEEAWEDAVSNLDGDKP